MAWRPFIDIGALDRAAGGLSVPTLRGVIEGLQERR
jgi:hypothetical protein